MTSSGAPWRPKNFLSSLRRSIQSPLAGEGRLVQRAGKTTRPRFDSSGSAERGMGLVAMADASVSEPRSCATGMVSATASGGRERHSRDTKVAYSGASEFVTLDMGVKSDPATPGVDMFFLRAI